MIGIVSVLFFMDFKISSIAFFGFGFLYWSTIKITRKKLQANSATIAVESTKLIKALQEGLGGIRDVLIDGLQETYYKIHKRVDGQLRYALSNITIMGGAPRPLIEAFSMVLISFLAYSSINSGKDISLMLPTLGVIAMAAQRLLPLVQQGYSSWTSILGGRESLIDVLELLDQPMPDYDVSKAKLYLPFENHLSLEDLDFSYASLDEMSGLDYSYVLLDEI